MSLVWSFGGTTLLTYAYRITLINDYLDIPERRGENQMIPFRHGTTFVPKYFDERVMVFGMAIRGANAAGLETTMDSLRAKLAPNTQQVLSCTREDATVRTALATVRSPLQVERHGSKTALIVVEFELADPLFRLSTLIADNTTTINSAPEAMVVTNPGTVEERNPTILLTGPLTNVVITNSTNGVVMTYTGAIAGGDTVTIYQKADGEYTAIHSVSGEVIGNVTHSGSAALMVIDVGVNNLSIASDVITTGTVKISFYPPFL